MYKCGGLKRQKVKEGKNSGVAGSVTKSSSDELG